MLKTIRKHTDFVLSTIAAILFIVSTLSTCISVIDRTFSLNLQVVWAEEVTRYTMIWATMLLIGIGMRKGLQTRLTLLSDKLPGNGRKALSILILVLITLFFALLFWYGLRSAIINRSQVTGVLQISVFYPYMAIPVGSFFVILECVSVIFELLLNKSGNGGESAW
ncbi:TRAP transporter small permease [Agathobaculum sp. TL06]